MCVCLHAQSAYACKTYTPSPGAGSAVRSADVQVLGEEAPLRPTHRLDTCTSGLAVLGRTPEFVAAFNRLLAADGAARPLRKLYRALSAAEPPLGPWLGTLSHCFLWSAGTCAFPLQCAGPTACCRQRVILRATRSGLVAGLHPPLSPQTSSVLPDACARALQARWCTGRR